ncbi:MAG: HNH endonuclease [Culicoidibacterales bacterium]
MQKISLEKQTPDCITGYFYVYDAKHPLGGKSGKVFVHRYIASLKIGRWVTSDESVHHIDENRQNNAPENLEVMTHSEHARHHQAELGYVSHEMQCSFCGNTVRRGQSQIDNNHSGKVFCDNDCRAALQKKFEVTKEELEKLVWELPATKLATMFGVSDKAIHKRCKKLGIIRPPRGYFLKAK